jgi:hypothetical protein
MSRHKNALRSLPWLCLVVACEGGSPRLVQPEPAASQAPQMPVQPAAIVPEGASTPEAAASAPAGELPVAEGQSAQLPGVTLQPEGEAAQQPESAAAPDAGQPPEASRYDGYLFTYFIGEGSPEGEQIYFALSRGNDPLDWQALNAGAPMLTSTVGTNGVRDPFIIRSRDGDRFYLIATDLRIYGDGDWDRAQRQGSQSIVVWESTDLVDWSAPRLVRVAPDTAGNTWAPEAFYDPSSGAYVVFWASKLYAQDDPTHTGDTYNRIMMATTQDFSTFSEPTVWHDPGYSVIDSTVVAVGDVFYRFTKDERDTQANNPCGKFITLESSLSLTNTRWDFVADCIGQGMVSRGEGPLVFKSNTEQKWYLFIDEFGGRGYVPFESTDLSVGGWVIPPEYVLPSSPRHGTVLPVSADEHQRLLDAFGSN